MRHVFMETVTEKLAELGIATFRYHFPYMEAGRRGPNHAPILLKTVRSAVAEAASLEPELPLLAGGKSMGGRMTSAAASTQPLPGVLGLAFFGFPLHTPGQDSDERGAHLADVGLPMLFLQGTRDRLARLDLLKPLLGRVKPASDAPRGGERRPRLSRHQEVRPHRRRGPRRDVLSLLRLNLGTGLICAQRLYRVGPRYPLGREVQADERDRGEHERHPPEYRGVGGAHTD